MAMAKNVTLWMDVPVNKRTTIDTSTRNKGCRAAVRGRGWWPCSSGLWSESAYFCYQHRSGDASRFEKLTFRWVAAPGSEIITPLPWWKRIKLQSPVKWGSDDTANLPG